MNLIYKSAHYNIFSLPKEYTFFNLKSLPYWKSNIESSTTKNVTYDGVNFKN